MEGNLHSPPCVLDTGEPSLRSPFRYDGCVNNIWLVPRLRLTSLYTSVAILVRTHECSTIPKSKFHAKAQRKSLFFAPLRALRDTSFSSNDGMTHIPRNISTRADLCITARAPAWEPLTCKFLLCLSWGEAGASKTPFPSRSLGTSKYPKNVSGGQTPASQPTPNRPSKLPQGWGSRKSREGKKVSRG